MKTIFESTPCLRETDLKGYVGQQLTPADRFRIENHLLDCPLCREAVAGFRKALQTDDSSVEEDLRRLRASSWDPQPAAD